MDAPDLEPVANDKAFIPAPRPEISRQRFGLTRDLGLKRHRGLFHIQ